MLARSPASLSRRRAAFMVSLLLVTSLVLEPRGARSEAVDLTALSIEDLMEIEVTSVSKRTQPLVDAAAAVSVITSDDIRRSGMTSIADVLRLVPGLHVASIDGSRWAITARGFNSQFANKLLVLIDGRTAYTHLFSGVFWDVQDLMLEDIDRIEVVRGPGGTLWGANAVNGVINVITKRADRTQGFLISGGGGTLERSFTSARYGTRIGKSAYVRGYIKYFNRADRETPDGNTASDQWDVARGGLRMDWNISASDELELQGDYYDGTTQSTLLTMARGKSDIAGGNILARWRHVIDATSDVSLKVYYDRTERDVTTVIGEDRNTVDVEMEHRLRLGSSQDVIWGLGYRLLNDDVRNSALIVFDPARRSDQRWSGFIQDQISMFEDRFQLTVGSKFEHNDYTGFEVQPNVRARWTLSPRQRLWAAVSRAVRTPSRADDDVTLIAPSDDPKVFFLLSGDRRFGAEHLLAYELGYRAALSDALTVDVATYYNEYDNLRSARAQAPSGPPFPPGLFRAVFANETDAVGYGIEVAANWTPTDYWTLSGSYTLMKLDVDAIVKSPDVLSDAQEHDTPTNQAQIHSRLRLPWHCELDAGFFYVGAVSHQGVGDYTRLDLRLGWRPVHGLELSIAGQNLSERRHEEFGSGFFTERSSVPRSVYGKITWQY